MDSCKIGAELLELRRDMAWRRAPLRDYFHASEDSQATRDEVFAFLKQHDFTIQANVMEKSKAQPQVRESHHGFYQYGWFYLFKHGIGPIHKDQELLLTTASVKTKKAQGAFTAAVNDVVQQHLNRNQWEASFTPCSCDPCLQVADYCTWAIQRKWERNDDRSYKLIKDRITYEYDLWARGKKHYY